MNQSAALLLQCSPAPAESLALDALLSACGARVRDVAGRIEVNRALDGSLLYVYFWLREGVAAEQSDAQALAAAARRIVADVDVQVVCLQPVLDRPGASTGEKASHHYVVETDLIPEAADALVEWYAQEHLPGLASVPGNIRSRRLQTRPVAGELPRSYACYDLTSPKTLERDEWLAVRATEWSSRVRPHFTHPRRVMFERLDARDL